MDEFAVHLKVFRWDPETGAEPSYAHYDVRIPWGMSVSNLLEHVQQRLDPTLVWSASCRRGLCCSCMARINGTVKLACLQVIRPEDGELTVEPADPRRVVKDLVTYVPVGRARAVLAEQDR